MLRTRVFVSYSHDDRDWLTRVSTHLAVLQRKGLLDLWSDERIAAGADWAREIEGALTAAKVAVLLVSPSFLASKFIWENEMPHILAHMKVGMDALPLILRPCAWRLEEELAKLQARPVDGTPLSLGSDSEIDLKLSEFAYELAARIGQSPAAPPMSSSTGAAPSVQPSLPEEKQSPLLGRWDGVYNDSMRMSLVVQSLSGDEFRGRLEYPVEGTSTNVEGTLFPQWSSDDPLWAKVTGSSKGNVRFVARFQETGYEKRGSKQISFDGEYRAAFEDEKAFGAWFSGDRLVGTFTLHLQGR